MKKLSPCLCLSVCLSVCLSLSHTHTHTHARTHARTHTHIHTHTTHTHTHTHTLTHTHTPQREDDEREGGVGGGGRKRSRETEMGGGVQKERGDTESRGGGGSKKAKSWGEGPGARWGWVHALMVVIFNKTCKRQALSSVNETVTTYSPAACVSQASTHSSRCYISFSPETLRRLTLWYVALSYLSTYLPPIYRPTIICLKKTIRRVDPPGKSALKPSALCWPVVFCQRAWPSLPESGRLKTGSPCGRSQPLTCSSLGQTAGLRTEGSVRWVTV